MTLAELIEAARKLAPTERYKLANRVLATAEEPTTDQSEIDSAWTTELRRRIDDIESGRVQMVDHGETVRIARARVDERRG